MALILLMYGVDHVALQWGGGGWRFCKGCSKQAHLFVLLFFHDQVDHANLVVWEGGGAPLPTG